MRGLPPELLLNDPRLDSQHAFLFQLLDMAETQKSMGPAEVGAVVKALLLYCKTHFSYEEGLMRTAGYPELDKHAFDHARLTTMCLDLADRIGHASHGSTTGPGALTQQLIVETLRMWLRDHILRPGFGDAAFVLWARHAGK